MATVSFTADRMHLCAYVNACESVMTFWQITAKSGGFFPFTRQVFVSTHCAVVVKAATIEQWRLWTHTVKSKELSIYFYIHIRKWRIEVLQVYRSRGMLVRRFPTILPIIGFFKNHFSDFVIFINFECSKRNTFRKRFGINTSLDMSFLIIKYSCVYIEIRTLFETISSLLNVVSFELLLWFSF